MSSKYEAISSFCAIFIAVIALGVAVYEAKVTRKHQEFSVWPHLIFYNTSVAQIDNREMPLASYLKNNGIGPALIKKLKITYKNKEYPDMGRVFKEVFPDEDVIMSDKDIARVILPGKDVLLLGGFINSSQIKKYNQKIKEGNVKIEVCFCSLYKKCWEIKKNNENSLVPSCKLR